MCDFQETWLLFITIATRRACFPHPSTHPWQRTAQLDARAGEARPKGKSEGMTGRSLLQTRQRKVFPALRCNQSHIRFNTSSIYVANRFFGTFLTQESTVLPSSPVPFWEPPQALAKQLKHFCAFMQCFIARKLHFIHTLGIIYGEKLWITWTTKWG